MATVEIKGLSGMIQKLRRLERDVDGIVDGAVRQSAEQIRSAAMNNIQNMSVSYNGHIYDAKDTGALMRSLHVTRIPGGYAVGTPLEYAPPVEFGTGMAGDPKVPHTARPSWVYYSEADGGFRTAHPRPPCPFLLPAFESHRNIVKLNITKAIIKAARGE